MSSLFPKSKNLCKVTVKLIVNKNESHPNKKLCLFILIYYLHISIKMWWVHYP